MLENHGTDKGGTTESLELYPRIQLAPCLFLMTVCLMI